MEITEKKLKSSRIIYIIEAAIEYFISILVAGSFLATITNELGFSDSLTGILSSIISLGCLFQLLSMFYRKAKVKRLVVIFSIINQLLFMLLYVIPLTRVDGKVKTAIFVFMIVLAYLTYNFVHPKKIKWLMSLVDDHKRGGFTAVKEMVSLISGIIFTFLMGIVADYFTAMGNIKGAFVVFAIVIFTLNILHTLTMVLTVEPETESTLRKEKFLNSIKELFKNKDVLKITILFVIYYVSHYISIPFYGTYEIKELGFSLTFVSTITMIGSISRIAVSVFWGKYADKRSFAKMLEKCFIFLMLSQICVAFAVPANGKIMLILYRVLNGVAMGGINSALTNLIFDYVPSEKRADSIAITQAVAGVTGFLTTLCISPVISIIQANGNKIFGIPMYAQQFVSILGEAVILFAILYVRLAIQKRRAKI